MKHGIGFITEDRKDEGLVLDFSIRENMALPNLFSFSSKVSSQLQRTRLRRYTDQTSTDQNAILRDGGKESIRG